MRTNLYHPLLLEACRILTLKSVQKSFPFNSLPPLASFHKVWECSSSGLSSLAWLPFSGSQGGYHFVIVNACLQTCALEGRPKWPTPFCSWSQLMTRTSLYFFPMFELYCYFVFGTGMVHGSVHSLCHFNCSLDVVLIQLDWELLQGGVAFYQRQVWQVPGCGFNEGLLGMSSYSCLYLECLV